MLKVRLINADFANDGFVYVGAIAPAIVRAIGSANPMDAERKIFSSINGAVQLGRLTPRDSDDLRELPLSDYGAGVVLFDELVAWGQSVGLFNFERQTAPASDSEPVSPVNEANDAPREEAPVAVDPIAEPKSQGLDWRPHKPKRNDGLAWPLYQFLKAAFDKGLPRPKPQDVMDEWTESKPSEIEEVMANEVKYYDGNGNVAMANTESIRKRIARMTTR